VTFRDIDAEWKKRPLPAKRRELIERLTGPERGWFHACRAWVSDGASPDEFPETIGEICDFLEQQSAFQLAVADAHLGAARLARDTHYPSGDTVASPDLDALYDRVRSDDYPQLSRAFLRSLVEALLDRLPPEEAASAAASFPLVWNDNRIDPELLALFRLRCLPSGVGEVCLDPEQAFVHFDKGFCASFEHARAVLEKLCTPGGDVCVRVEYLEPTGADSLIRFPLVGDSAGGALALRLWSAWTGTPLEAGVVASFALTAPDDSRPDGQCHPIGSEIAKARGVRNTRGGDGIFVVAREQRAALIARAEQMRLKVATAQTVAEAIEIASGRMGEVLAYLDSMIADANRVPPYYPRDARLERVRVRVRVSSERQKFDPHRASDRERSRQMGLTDEPDEDRPYRHRFDMDGRTDGTERDEPQVQILDWDRDVRPRLRRGVIVADPGLGKTWLLRWEAARHAEDAKKSLQGTGDLTRITLPVFCRLTDVAEALHILTQRRQHGTTDLPALPEAILERLFQANVPAKVRDLTRDWLGTERCLLLLDAFDEVPAERRPALLQALGDWVRTHAQARVYFTSRVVGYTPPWSMPARNETEREMELLPFDDIQIGSFLDAFFASDAAAARALRDLILRAPQLRGMAQIPLLLGFLAALYAEDPARRGDFASMRRTELYDRCLRRLLSGAWHDTPRLLSDEEVDAKLELLEQVAFELFAAGKEQFSVRELRRVTNQAYEGLYGERLSEAELTARIREWSETDGLLVKAGAGDNPPYLFLHLTFQEYLTACALAEQLEKLPVPGTTPRGTSC
jgi:hypothetical protein